MARLKLRAFNVRTGQGACRRTASAMLPNRNQAPASSMGAHHNQIAVLLCCALDDRVNWHTATHIHRSSSPGSLPIL